MLNQVTVIMYHYIRQLEFTQFPKIKAMLETEFINQINYLESYYHFITIEDCINSIFKNKKLPKNSLLLTFDDGYRDHFNFVFPTLYEKNIQGIFFPSAKAILEDEVLDVNKIHFILAKVDINDILREIKILIQNYKKQFKLSTYDYYYNKLASQSTRFDSKVIVFIKRLLQYDLPKNARNVFLTHLFSKFVTKDEKSFSRQLYLDIKQIKCMIKNGMYFGSHGYEHTWLSTLSEEELLREINASIKFLELFSEPMTEGWIISYPYGNYSNNIVKILKDNKCKIAFTTIPDITPLTPQNAFTLQRFDANDFPKSYPSPPNIWTKKITIQ